jgi:hypothetical protein
MSRTNWWRCLVTSSRGNHEEIKHLPHEGFGVFYRTNYLDTFVRELCFSFTKLQPKHPHRPESPDEILEERVGNALDEESQPHSKPEGDEGGGIVEDGICTDGGIVLGC